LRIWAIKRKWGSCSTAGRLTLNAELATQPAQFRREVVVHELLHLKVPNHGRVFKALMKAYLAEGGEEASAGMVSSVDGRT